MNTNAFTHHRRLTMEAHRIGKPTDAQRTRIHGRIEPGPTLNEFKFVVWGALASFVFGMLIYWGAN